MVLELRSRTEDKDLRKTKKLNSVSAAIARGKRPVSFRTRKLRLSAPMVLQGGPCGRVGHRRTYFRNGHPRGWPFLFNNWRIMDKPRGQRPERKGGSGAPSRGFKGKGKPRPGGDRPGRDGRPRSSAPRRDDREKREDTRPKFDFPLIPDQSKMVPT